MLYPFVILKQKTKQTNKQQQQQQQQKTGIIDYDTNSNNTREWNTFKIRYINYEALPCDF